MPRLFTAIELPDDIRDDLHRMRMPLPGARWIDAKNYHVTLRFAGDIDNAAAREFSANLAALEPDGFELRLSGAGAFGGNDPRSVFAAVEHNAQLDALAAAHEKAARNAGLPPETRTFAPHVTLARLRYSSAEAVARFLTQYGGYRSEPFFVTRVVLMSARPGVGGGPYAIEETLPMRGMAFIDEDDADW